MSVFQKISTTIRNAWLAGLGAVSFSKKNTTIAIDKMTEKSESYIDELIVEGAGLERELSEKLRLRMRLDRRISAINNALGRTNSANDDKLLLLSDKVEQLTIVVNALIERKAAENKVVKKSITKPAKNIVVKSAA